jgi:long-chain acyl-CoA synthetase
MKANISSIGQVYKNRYQPDKTALIFGDERVSFTQLDVTVRAFANFLRGKGVTRNDKVILNAGNCPEFIYTYLGTVRNAAIIVPVNPTFTLPELTYIAKDSDAKFLIIIEGILLKLGHTEATLSELLGLTVFSLNEKLLQEIMASPKDDFDYVTDIQDISTFLYTSGTTGQPKAAMLTHYNLIANAWQCNVALESVTEDIFMCVLPMFHVFACTAAVLMPLFTGSTVVIVEAFQPKTVIGSLLANNITVFMGVPAMYMLFIEAGKNNIFFPKLRLAISGGAALPVEVYHKAKEIANLPVIEGYGLTEASPASAFNPPSGVQKPGSIGLALPEIDAIIGDENGKELPIGEVGELLLRGPNVMQGYYNRPDDTAEILKNGWLHTGDLAKMDEERYIYIVDRKKDMIIVAGLNVYPREVEEVLYQHPKIRDAAVIGEEDKLRGEAVVAYIVLKEGETASEDEILRWLKERLAGYKIPRHLIFAAELPRTGSGKILKRMLREKS